MPVSADPLWEEGRTAARIRLFCSPAPHSDTAVERLTDDLLVEILSHFPAKSICRFKCVSKHWLSLIDNPDNRRKLPQTMAGFFYNSTSMDRVQLTSVTGSCRPLICTSVALLPNHGRIVLLDGCNGLLLCMWFLSAQGAEFRYVVCNPATQKWVALPDPEKASRQDIVYLGFDPAVSSNFYVFALLEKDYGEWNPYLCGVEVYSSDTGRWVHKECEWEGDTQLHNYQSSSVFLNGYLHFQAFDCVSSSYLTVVDTKGEPLTHIPIPGGIYRDYIQLSQGCLHYINFRRDEDSCVTRLVVYVIEYGSKEWTLKHSVETSYIFGENHVSIHWNFDWIAIHPHCNLIFFTVGQNIVTCYNMDHRQIEVIPNTINGHPLYVPYVPLYSELPSLDM